MALETARPVPRRLAGALAIALLLCCSSRASAEVEQVYHTWIGAYFQGRIAGPVFTQSDIQYRSYDDFSPFALVVRPGVSLRIREGMLATLGYAFAAAWGARGGELLAMEQRIWQQFWYEYVASNGIRLQTRTRLEQRFRSPGEGLEVGIRAREMLRMSVPVALERRLTFVIWDEMFVGFNSAGGSPTVGGAPTIRWQFAGFDQNRLFVGMGYQVVPTWLRLELGYFNDWIRRPGAAAGDLLIHALMLNAFIGWP